ncbi:hypothetical protein [Corynebacterium sp. H113]|uniref:hypothetical protein n=1 Tax=Corynebacterium sp. H113 TaxID=3133419 RepID=UPI00309B6146
MTQKPMPGHGFIDEAEARRRYRDPSALLTILPPVDASTGIVPYYVVVTTGPRPAFTVFEQIEPGVVEAEVWFSPTAGDRLFATRAMVRQFPPKEELLVRNNSLAIKTMTVENREDGTGTIQIRQRDSSIVEVADRRGMPVASLYRDLPEFGQWQTLRVL